VATRSSQQHLAAARDDRCGNRRVSDSRPHAGAVETSPTEHPPDLGMLSICAVSKNRFSFVEWHGIAFI
jgi:hypothetical protein